MNRKPNILFFFTDMQRFDTIHALGNPVIRTPNLDRLVNEGTAFSAAYSPSPVCVPARCSMHYGRYPARTGVADNVAMSTSCRPRWAWPESKCLRNCPDSTIRESSAANRPPTGPNPPICSW